MALFEQFSQNQNYGGSHKVLSVFKILKEHKPKEYSFRNDDVEDFFKSLLEEGLIELPKPQRPDEVGRVWGSSK